MARKCRNKNCRTELPKRKDCEDQVQRGGFCSYTCLAIHGREKAEQQRERQRKKERKEARQDKIDLKKNDTAHQRKLTVQTAQKLANRLDGDLPCICCGRPRKSQFSGGHYLTKGAHPELAIDLRNIHGQQNHTCNLHLSGNIHGANGTHGYTEGLRARYGDAILEWLNGPHQPLKFNAEQYRALRKLYNAEIRRMERGEGPSRDWRSLDYTVHDLINP